MKPLPAITAPTTRGKHDARPIAFVDCGSGISGDMMLGALLSAGLPLSHLRRELRKLDVRGFTIASSEVRRNGFAATRFEVSVGKKAGELRRWNDVRTIIRGSTLSAPVKRTSLAIFRNLFDAEARVHGMTRGTVHLHELAAVDCIVDIVGTAVGLDFHGIEGVWASPVNLGSGTIETGHGILRVPAPATAELLKNIPVFVEGPAFELTTPTGAAILATIATGFGTLPEMAYRQTGVGAGSRDPASWANVLRLFLGTAPAVDFDEDVVVLETNIDDMEPRAFEPLSDRLFRRGALDVFLENVLMKKFRPAVRLTVLCPPGKEGPLADTILEESTTLGVRIYGAGRRILERSSLRVKTPYGVVRVKLGFLRGRLVTVMPEYEDVRRAAEKSGVSFRRARESAVRLARGRGLPGR